MDERDPGLFPLQGLLLNGDQERTVGKTKSLLDRATSDSNASAGAPLDSDR